MTDPIDLLDEASWLGTWRVAHVPDNRLLAVAPHRTVGDLRHVLALARDAEGLRAALEWMVASFGSDIEQSNRDAALQEARAALEGTDR